jgi:hypothetical protein
MTDTDQTEARPSESNVASAAIIANDTARTMQIGLGVLKGITQKMAEQSREGAEIDSDIVGVWAEEIDWFIDVFRNDLAVVRRECKRAGVPEMWPSTIAESAG